MIYYFLSALIILLTTLIPLFTAYLCFNKHNKIISVGFVVGATLSLISLLGFKFLMSSKSYLLIAVILNSFSSSIGLLREKQPRPPSKLYLYGVISLTNIFLGAVLFSDLINFNFHGLGDDKTGIVIGIFFSLITLILFYRKSKNLTSS